MKRIIWSVTLIPLIATAILMQFMPESVPMHFDLSGNADRWGSKYELFIVPAIIMVVILLFSLLIIFFEKKSRNMPDEKSRAGAASNAKALKIIVLCLAVFFAAVDGFILYNAYSMSKGQADEAVIDMVRIICILVGVLMIITANFLPKSRKNSIIGLRTKWSMYNDNTWRKSNMFGAIVLMLVGTLTIIAAAVTTQMLSVILMLVFLLGGAAVCAIYSNIVYKTEMKKADE